MQYISTSNVDAHLLVSLGNGQTFLRSLSPNILWALQWNGPGKLGQSDNWASFYCSEPPNFMSRHTSECWKSGSDRQRMSRTNIDAENKTQEAAATMLYSFAYTDINCGRWFTGAHFPSIVEGRRMDGGFLIRPSLVARSLPPLNSHFVKQTHRSCLAFSIMNSSLFTRPDSKNLTGRKNSTCQIGR